MKIYSIQRHRIGIDGEGITSLVAMMGCPLSCKYCINKNVLAKEGYGISEEDLIERLAIDACYMIYGGGVTFGGGEPLIQVESLLRFAELRPEWMQMNIETSLNADSEVIKKLLPHVKEWIVDIKSLDKDIYKTYTGQSPDLMLQNLELIRKAKSKIRVPVIPGFKDKSAAENEAKLLKMDGFTNVEVFQYVLK